MQPMDCWSGQRLKTTEEKTNREKVRESITYRALKSPRGGGQCGPGALAEDRKKNTGSTDGARGHTTSLKSKMFEEMLRKER